jgi:hypothetical protein
LTADRLLVDIEAMEGFHHSGLSWEGDKTMVPVNKAHTATVNRIVRRYRGRIGSALDVDIETDEGIVEVETEATIGRGIRQLKKFRGPVYLAVTNNEALPEALRATGRSRIGVMDPRGNIVKPAGTRERAAIERNGTRPKRRQPAG